MKLSILDQSPISTNQTAQEALYESMKLAQAGEAFGYTRYWIAEHHDFPGLACSSPEVMLGFIGAHTSTIRIGAGAVLLPHYKPYKVAEVFNMLSTLFPNRMDLGIGRAPGGSAEVTNALSDHFLQKVWDMPNAVQELLQFLDDHFPAEHQYANVSASPIPKESPVPWILGTSKKSALLAAKNGLAYAFGQFMSNNDGADIIQEYLETFKPRRQGQKPEVILTVSAICAETTEKAEEIAHSSLIWTLQKETGKGHQYVPSLQEAKKVHLNDKEKESLAKMKKNMIIGNPREVKQKLLELQRYQTDEIMLVTVTHSPQDRIQSYRLISKEMLHST